MATTTGNATEHSLPQQFQRDVHLLTVAQLTTLANASEFFTDDVEIRMRSSVNQSCTRGITRRLESFAIDGSTRRIKQDPSEFLGGSKLPNACRAVKNPCVVHVSTCKRTPKCT
jgi:hypothetical protein